MSDGCQERPLIQIYGALRKRFRLTYRAMEVGPNQQRRYPGPG